MRFTGDARVRHLVMRDRHLCGGRASRDATASIVLAVMRSARFYWCSSAIHVGCGFCGVRWMGYKLSILLRRLALARKSLQWVKAGLPCTERTHPINSLAPPGRSLVTMGGEGRRAPLKFGYLSLTSRDSAF